MGLCFCNQSEKQAHLVGKMAPAPYFFWEVAHGSQCPLQPMLGFFEFLNPNGILIQRGAINPLIRIPERTSQVLTDR